MTQNMSPADVRKTLEMQAKELEKMLKRNPQDYTSMFKYAVRLHLLDLHDDASAILLKLVKLGAEQVEVYEIGGKALIKAGRLKEAVEVLEKGLSLHPDSQALRLLLGNALNSAQDFKSAEEALITAYEKNPSNIDTIMMLGVFYMNMGYYDKAAFVLRKGLDVDPDNIPMLNNLGTIYMNMKEFVPASEYFLKALKLDNGNLACISNIAGCFEKMDHAEVALQFYDAALDIQKDYGPVICAKASMLCNHGMAQETQALYKEGLELLSKDEKARRNLDYLLHRSNYVFYIHYIPEFSRQNILDEILGWQKEMCGDSVEIPSLAFPNAPEKDRKLKIGLISGGFSVHPVGQMILGALENIDKDKFEILIFSDTPPGKKDYIHEKFIALADHYDDTFGIINYEVIERIRGQNIDILVELSGHSDGGRRLPLVAERVAPVQLKWVGGLFNTTGIPQMDWILGDAVEIPEGDEEWYTEKVYRMPDDYIVYTPPYYAPEVGALPALEKGYVTFGNLNNLTKTNSYSIELWSKIMHKVPNSKLLLKFGKMNVQFVQDHIKSSFAKHGITEDRLILEGGEKHQAFLGVYNRIDIGLDPHPYTGGLTTCEAMWMGVPVVTLPGETFAGRHAASHLTTAGLTDWVAKSEQDYIDIAVKWAQDLDGLARLRARLREKVAASPLVDGVKFAKNFEIALRHMWADWCDMKLSQTDKPQNKQTGDGKGKVKVKAKGQKKKKST
ncbi:MAG: tetratricopeptide repeat protein [Alphaproteobacteria bacterium]